MHGAVARCRHEASTPAQTTAHTRGSCDSAPPCRRGGPVHIVTTQGLTMVRLQLGRRSVSVATALADDGIVKCDEEIVGGLWHRWHTECGWGVVHSARRRGRKNRGPTAHDAILRGVFLGGRSLNQSMPPIHCASATCKRSATFPRVVLSRRNAWTTRVRAYPDTLGCQCSREGCGREATVLWSLVWSDDQQGAWKRRLVPLLYRLSRLGWRRRLWLHLLVSPSRRRTRAYVAVALVVVRTDHLGQAADLAGLGASGAIRARAGAPRHPEKDE